MFVDIVPLAKTRVTESQPKTQVQIQWRCHYEVSNNKLSSNLNTRVHGNNKLITN